MNVCIFTADQDAGAAEKCAGHLERHGCVTHVLTDSAIGATGHRTRGLMGAEMAKLMARAMLDRSGGGVVARIDADTLVTGQGFDWLAGAGPTEARGYFEGYARRCSPFSVHADHLRAAMPMILSTSGKACAGCTICAALRVGAKGRTIERKRGIIRWDRETAADVSANPDHRIEEEAEVIALEPALLPVARSDAMKSLWLYASGLHLQTNGKKKH